MKRESKRLREWILPDVPAGIRDDFFVHAASELQRHAPWLFAAMFLNSMIAMATGAPEAHWFFRLVLPAIMGAYCLFSLWALRSDWQFAEKPWRARKFLRDSALSSGFGAVICTAWCVSNWIAAPVEARMHFPIILVMGGLATAYCLASVKVGAIANLVIDIVPIAVLMMLSGNPAEYAAAVSLLLAGLFQLTMIRAHYRRVIQLLVLQQQARELADTDALTGLANRRALLARAHDATARGLAHRLMLVDIDRFKSINDDFGHDVGDKVLCEMAELIAAHAPPGVLPARIGGEEFALFGREEDLPSGIALTMLQESRQTAFPHAQPVTVSIGIADAIMGDEAAWDLLYRECDRALYAAKRDGRNRIAVAEDIEEPAASEAAA